MVPRSSTSTRTAWDRPPRLDDLDLDLDHAVVIVEWGRGMVDGLRDEWWEVEPTRPGATPSADEAELDADAPRVATVTRRP